MQRRSGAIKPDIGRDLALLRARIQRFGLRHLVNEAALGQNVEKIGFIRAHYWISDSNPVTAVAVGVTGPPLDSTMGGAGKRDDGLTGGLPADCAKRGSAHGIALRRAYLKRPSDHLFEDGWPAATK